MESLAKADGERETIGVMRCYAVIHAPVTRWLCGSAIRCQPATNLTDFRPTEISALSDQKPPHITTGHAAVSYLLRYRHVSVNITCFQKLPDDIEDEEDESEELSKNVFRRPWLLCGAWEWGVENEKYTRLAELLIRDGRRAETLTDSAISSSTT